jgi:uncharacterized membrane protein
VASSPTGATSVHHARVRALAKAVSWRLLGTVATTAAVLVFTGRWVLALSIGGVEGVVKIALYFIHERVWDRVAFGRHVEGGREQGAADVGPAERGQPPVDSPPTGP